MPNEAEMTAWMIGGLIAVILLFYGLWALFGDRSRGRRRCPRCSYELGDVPGTVCPECGHAAKSEAAFSKPRRHWRRAAVALILMLMVAIVVRMRATETGWLMLIPDRILVMSIPLDSRPGTGPVVIELKRRLLVDALSQGACDALLERLINGDMASPPGTETWERRYGHLANHWGKMILEKDSPHVRKMRSILPLINVTVPGSWPQDKPIPAMLSISEWWPLGTEGHVEIYWPEEGGEELANIAFRNYSSGGRPFAFHLPPRNQWPEGSIIDLKVNIRTRRPSGDWDIERPEMISWEDFSEPRRSTARVIAPVDGTIVLKPVDTPELDQLVKKVFSPGLRRSNSTKRPYAIRFDPRSLQDDAPSGVAFGFKVEIIEQSPDGVEQVRRRSQIWINTSPNTSVRSGWLISQEDIQGLAGAFQADNPNTWVMRVSGELPLAERVLAREGSDLGAYQQYWAGSVAFPLPVHRERGARYIRHWFHQDGPPKPE